MVMSELLIEGLDLLVIGMGTVFLFLTFLVVCVGWMSKLVRRFETPEDAKPAPAAKPATEPAGPPPQH
ncbi:MAG: OadG family protein, partial [Alphaproteobacteria bacterium]|nr:OadG family protein [Alphaproteobacteria bacterium]